MSHHFLLEIEKFIKTERDAVKKDRVRRTRAPRDIFAELKKLLKRSSTFTQLNLILCHRQRRRYRVC